MINRHFSKYNLLKSSFFVTPSRRIFDDVIVYILVISIRVKRRQIYKLSSKVERAGLLVQFVPLLAPCH